MENLVLFLMYAYPGALVELIYSWTAPHLRGEREEESFVKYARYILTSAMVLFFSMNWFMFVTGQQNVSIQTLQTIITTGNSLMIYTLVSLFVTLMIAFVTALARVPVRRVVNWTRNLFGMPSLMGYGTVWESITTDQNEVSIDKCVAFVYKGEHEIAHGLLEMHPRDMKREHALTLIQSDVIDETIEQDQESAPDKRYIGKTLLTYVDLEHDYKVVFKKAPELVAFLKQGKQEAE